MTFKSESYARSYELSGTTNSDDLSKFLGLFFIPFKAEIMEGWWILKDKIIKKIYLKRDP